MSACIIHQNTEQDVNYSTAICFCFVCPPSAKKKNELVKPGLNSVIRWHIFRVKMPLYGKTTQQWNKKTLYTYTYYSFQSFVFSNIHGFSVQTKFLKFST